MFEINNKSHWRNRKLKFTDVVCLCLFTKVTATHFVLKGSLITLSHFDAVVRKYNGFCRSQLQSIKLSQSIAYMIIICISIRQNTFFSRLSDRKKRKMYTHISALLVLCNNQIRKSASHFHPESSLAISRRFLATNNGWDPSLSY